MNTRATAVYERKPHGVYVNTGVMGISIPGQVLAHRLLVQSILRIICHSHGTPGVIVRRDICDIITGYVISTCDKHSLSLTRNTWCDRKKRYMHCYYRVGNMS